MRKYWVFYRLSLQNAFAYRGASILWRLGSLISLITFAFVWLSSEASGQIGGLTKHQLVTYYFFGIFLSSFVFWLPYTNIAKDISEGGISLKYLLKPVSHFWSLLFMDLGWHTFSPILGVGTMFIGYLIFRDYLIISFSTDNILPLLLSVSLAAILCFNVAYLIGLLAFFTTHVEASSSLLYIGLALFGGEAIPVSFFSGNLSILVAALPFRYIFSFPLEIYFGRLNLAQMVFGFLVGILWIFIFHNIGKIIWSKGLKNYSSYGN